MKTSVRYPLSEIITWSRYEIFIFLFYDTLVLVLYHVFDFVFLHVPWTPIALIGTAVAFLIGFQSNAAYGRIWEARMIWGAIVNSSRTFGMMVKDMVNNDHTRNPLSEKELKAIHTELTYRHIAWLTALRYAMRSPKKWEEFYNHKSNRDHSDYYYIPEAEENFETVMRNYINAEEYAYIEKKGNKATTLLNMQSNHLKRLKEKGLIWEFSFLELENVLEELFTHQGKSERIKNFPYPKQFSSITFYITLIFIALLPFGLIHHFEEAALELESKHNWGHYFIYAMIPFCVVVSWVFSIMQRVSLVGDNPFEGTANDVPISAIARGIEIDLRQQLDEDSSKIPAPFPEEHDIQM